MMSCLQTEQLVLKLSPCAEAASILALTALTVNWTGDTEAAWAAALSKAGGQAVGSVLHRRGIPTRLAEVKTW